MNKDEIVSLTTHIATLVLSSGSAAAYVDGSSATALAGGLGALVSVCFGVYSHWNQKKVPETAIVK